MNDFLASVERRAFSIANMAVGNREDALDLVQDSMIKLVENYLHKPQQDWPALFYKILQSKIRDFYRRDKVRNRWRVWLNKLGLGEQQHHNDSDDAADPISQLPDRTSTDAPASIDNHRSMQLLHTSLQALPLRQQQAFLLRAWEGLSTEETAQAMGISSGSVKTHYSRARAILKHQLQDYQL